MATAGTKPKKGGGTQQGPNRKQRRARRTIVAAPDTRGVLAKCRCGECAGGRTWPRYYTGLVRVTPVSAPEPRSKRVSWECHLEGNAPEIERETPSMPTTRDARAAGLTVDDEARDWRLPPLPPTKRLRKMVRASMLPRAETVEKFASFYGVEAAQIERRLAGEPTD